MDSKAVFYSLEFILSFHMCSELRQVKEMKRPGPLSYLWPNVKDPSFNLDLDWKFNGMKDKSFHTFSFAFNSRETRHTWGFPKKNQITHILDFEKIRVLLLLWGMRKGTDHLQSNNVKETLSLLEGYFLLYVTFVIMKIFTYIFLWQSSLVPPGVLYEAIKGTLKELSGSCSYAGITI